MLSSRSVYTGKRTSHVSPLSPINANLKERTRRVCVNSFKELDAISVQGTSRKQNEDRYLVEDGTDAGYQTIAAVFDGHGGNATAEWLKVNFSKYVAKFWQETYSPEAAMTEAFLAADRRILTPKKGLSRLERTMVRTF